MAAPGFMWPVGGSFLPRWVMLVELVVVGQVCVGSTVWLNGGTTGMHVRPWVLGVGPNVVLWKWASYELGSSTAIHTVDPI